MTHAATLEREYTAPDVMEITGLSYRQVDYYARTGLVVPSIREARGSGSQRVYSRDDIEKLMAIVTLTGAGVSIRAIRRDGLEGSILRLTDALRLINA